MFQYDFNVPETKKIRLIIHTDCKNEADDQYALAHHLMTPKFMVKGIIAAHFDKNVQEYGAGNTMDASFQEILKMLDLMGLSGEYPVLKGAPVPMEHETDMIESEGADFIIEEAMREDEHPLYIVCQGSVTDLACAILKKPEICGRMTAVWIGGGKWPEGCKEFNLKQDIPAANVVFKSDMPLWQVPIDVYKQVAVSLAELQYKVKPCGKVGEYLFRQMVDYNNKFAWKLHWPQGETWGLGDQATVTVLLDELERMNYDMMPAPEIREDMTYNHTGKYRPIRVYHTLDARMTMEDFYAKLAINFRDK
ncbi:nucleoside hydrolase [Anaerolentibacter hominis]|uniref:nucleoside hydrolase n=1 Tax=Anaerolentibacter hominis TaxID=3079009 RepID=UPI0031B86483